MKLKNVMKPAIGLALFLFLFTSTVYAIDIAVIVNASGPLVNAAKSDIKEIYLGEKRFEGGVKIIPLLFPEGGIKEAFLKEALRMTPKEYKIYWTRRIFQDGIPVPKTLARTDDIINTVRNDKGGIGFLPREILSNFTGVKVIMVIKH